MKMYRFIQFNSVIPAQVYECQEKAVSPILSSSGKKSLHLRKLGLSFSSPVDLGKARSPNSVIPAQAGIQKNLFTSINYWISVFPSFAGTEMTLNWVEKGHGSLHFIQDEYQ
jgi:hypothetical protein